MENIDEVIANNENEESVSPPKQAKIDSFQAAFGDLKNSEFFNKDLPQNSTKAGPSKVKTSFVSLLVNPKQKGNPLLKYVKNVTWEYTDVVPDYVMGASVCALYLSLRYHQLNPDYIHERLKLLGNAYNLRVLLVQIDVPEPHHSLKHLTRICILADLTLMLAWSTEDSARIIETYKIYENKPPDMIMERADADPHQKIMSALTTVRSVNKTDAMTLMSTYGTVSALLKATPNSLSLCPGFGMQKAQRLHKGQLWPMRKLGIYSCGYGTALPVH